MWEKKRRMRTWIVATLGPASAAETTIVRLRKAGVGMFRVNLSHGERMSQRAMIRSGSASGAEVMIDLCGAKVRVEEARPPLPSFLIAGKSLCLSTGPGPLRHEGLRVTGEVRLSRIRKGDPVLLDDGNIVLRVVGSGSRKVKLVVEAGGRLLPKKGVSLPSRAVRVPLLVEEDRVALDELAGEPFDWVAVPFVQRAAQIRAIRRHLGNIGVKARVIAKIEDAEGVRRAGSILDEADALLVARGDLGVSLPLPRLPFLQKQLIALAARKRKPVIVATQMLESMTEHPRPTRAEVTDVANAVLEGADALLLSAETAVGKYPVDAVSTMAEIAGYAERRRARFASVPVREPRGSASRTS
jgi:pyruvate kinase